MTKPYSKLVAEAERAVAEVKDADLRRIAFERILNDLLGSGDDTIRNSSGTKTKIVKKTRKLESGKNRSGPQAYIEEMARDGFFKQPKTISEVKGELENRGRHIPITSLSGPMQALCQKKVLRRHKPDGKTFSYSEW